MASRSCPIASGEDGDAGNPGRHQGGVYTAKVVSARGFGLQGIGQKELAVEDGDDADRAGPGMRQEARQFVALVAMENAVAHGFPKPAEVMQDDLGGGVEFVQPRVAEVASKEGREIAVRLKAGDDHPAARPQRAKRMPEAVERGRSERKGEVKQDPVDRTV